MGDPAKIGGKAWRQNLKEQRGWFVRELNFARDPKTFDEAILQIDLVRQLTKTL